MTTTDASGSEPYPLGDLLIAARKRRHLSIAGSAERAGVSKGQWHNIERGRRSDGRPYHPAPHMVVKAARAVHADPREALEAAGYDPAIDAPDLEPTASITGPEIAAKVARLTPAQQAAVLATIDAMLDPDREPPKREPLDADQ
ncbi:helix-turn-helix transcriptional regulator [Saccharopolyspora taberi]|uniref:HTH cro/C1-type domain-containing protein n=1 Tax=Saccharopolyspora taberi TaxID=60895 RepID=A0ABN3V193_9PSEU